MADKPRSFNAQKRRARTCWGTYVRVHRESVDDPSAAAYQRIIVLASRHLYAVYASGWELL